MSDSHDEWRELNPAPAYTPPGTILVGERGSELISQPGGKIERAVYQLSVRGADAIAEVSASLDRLAVAERKVDRATRETTKGLERLIARIDARIGAEERLQAYLAQLGDA